jgi:hypothetical protein
MKEGEYRYTNGISVGSPYAFPPGPALIAITHNLAVQIFRDQTYLLASSLTVRTDA